MNALGHAAPRSDERWKMFNRRLGMFVHWGVYSVGGAHEQEWMRRGLSKAEYERYAVGEYLLGGKRLHARTGFLGRNDGLRGTCARFKASLSSMPSQHCAASTMFFLTSASVAPSVKHPGMAGISAQ